MNHFATVFGSAALALALVSPATAEPPPVHCYIHAEFVEVVVHDYYQGEDLGTLIGLLHAEMDQSQLRDSLEGIAKFLYTTLPAATDDVDQDASGLSQAMLDGCLNSWNQRQRGE